MAIDARRKETETMEGEQTMWVSNRAHECHTMQAESRRSTGKTQATFVCARWVLSACVSVRANCRPPSERFMKSMQAQSSHNREADRPTHTESGDSKLRGGRKLTTRHSDDRLDPDCWPEMRGRAAQGVSRG